MSRAIGPIRLSDPGERLATGNGWIPIMGYGDIEVKAKAPAPRNQQTIKLKDVAFIPTFFTNVVSLKRLIKGGIEWLTTEDKLMLGNQVFCLVEQRLGQWVLEYNPIQQASTATERPQNGHQPSSCDPPKHGFQRPQQPFGMKDSLTVDQRCWNIYQHLSQESSWWTGQPRPNARSVGSAKLTKSYPGDHRHRRKSLSVESIGI
jgi:hypothetical protein